MNELEESLSSLSFRTSATLKNKQNEIQKPFLKWVGGKTQIINNVIDKFPKEINNYHELFLGGGSVLLAVLSLQKQSKIKITNKIYAYDINKTLIYVYKHIQKDKDELYRRIDLYITEYDKITGVEVNRNPKDIEEAKTSKESYYYWMRKKYNEIWKHGENLEGNVEYSALFMFINKTCFRGMYREGPNGYNVPYGHYKKTPTIITKKDLNYISELIKDVEFIHSDFSSSIKNIQHGDFVYLDPPYAPENKNSFVGYVSDGFNLEKHNKLFSEIKRLDRDKIKIVMSNAKVDLVLDFFKTTESSESSESSGFGVFKCEDIIARRSINSKKPGSKTTEVLIYN
jgi:DNA adenine methylase